MDIQEVVQIVQKVITSVLMEMLTLILEKWEQRLMMTITIMVVLIRTAIAIIIVQATRILMVNRMLNLIYK
ncbi:hypothetical protein ACOL24_03830 [Aliarcobacter butzleri]